MNCSMRNWIILFFIVLAFGACRNSKRFVLISPDGSQKITILSQGRTVYVSNGRGINEKENYVVFKLLVPGIDESIFGCWRTSSYEWSVLLPGAEIVENKLDTSRFKVIIDLKYGEKGYPMVEKFHEENCFEFDRIVGIIRPKGYTSVEEL